MLTEKNYTQAREVVGVFDNAVALEAAIDELLSSGFDRADLSLLASTETVDAKLGRHYKRVEEIECREDVPRTHYVSTDAIGLAEGALVSSLVYVGALVAAGAVVASGGSLAATIAGAALAGGGGGLIGVALANLVGKHHAQYLQEQLERGGLLLWVHAWDEAREARAREILKRNSGRDVHACEISKAA